MKRNGLLFILALVVGLSFAVTANAKVIRWKMTSTWPPSISLIEADQAFVKAVNHLCKGKLKIQFFSFFLS